MRVEGEFSWVKVDTNKIPAEGLSFQTEAGSSELGVETDLIKFRAPLRIKADIVKVTGFVIAKLIVDASIHGNCSRCLDEFEINFKKEFQLSYSVNKSESIIDLAPDIRDEIILDYPINPLCKTDCKGLCFKCGKNLNEGDCECVGA